MSADEVPQEILDHALGALVASAYRDHEHVEASFDRLVELGPFEALWPATCAWVEAIHQRTQGPDGRLNAFTVETTGPAPTAEQAETQTVLTLAVQIVACIGNDDRETAFLLWREAGPERAGAASAAILRLAGDLCRQHLEETEAGRS